MRSIMNKNLCPHCDPYITDSAHIPEKIGGAFSALISFLIPVGFVDKSSRVPQSVNKAILYSLIRTLLILRIVQEIEINDLDESIRNRSLVVIREAHKRGVSIKALRVLGRSDIGVFSFEVNGVKRFFDDLPHATIERVYTVDLDDKEKVKELLRGNGLPAPYGMVCKSYREALWCVEKIGFPVVVKPRAGSLSRHTTCNIKTNEELKEAVNIVQMISREFIVEEFVPGNVYRAIVVNGEVVGVCMREAPNVVGDGMYTIRELVHIKNRNPLRGDTHQKNVTLHKIPLGLQAASRLAEQGVEFDDVLPAGKKVYLHKKVILSCGADIHDVTDIVHPDNIALLKKVYDLCETPVAGIDIVSRDISQPYLKEKCVTLEVNGLPYIDMHHYPTTGTPRDVAGKILDYCLAHESIK